MRYACCFANPGYIKDRNVYSFKSEFFVRNNLFMVYLVVTRIHTDKRVHQTEPRDTSVKTRKKTFQYLLYFRDVEINDQIKLGAPSNNTTVRRTNMKAEHQLAKGQ